MSPIEDGVLDESIRQLAQLLIADQTRDATLDAIAGIADEAIPACIAASVTMGDRGRPYTAVSSAALADVLDEHQYETREGPCLDAIRTRHEVVVASVAEEARWPRFMRVVRDSPVQSILSFPMIAGDEVVGALNLYGDGIDGLLGARASATTFARIAAISMANALAYDRAAELAGQLTEALERRDVIGQAKGMLMAAGGLTADEAFERLREQSQHSNRKLYAVALELVGRDGDDDGSVG